MTEQLNKTSGDDYPLSFRTLEIPETAIAEINRMLDWHAATMLDGHLLGRLGVDKRTRPADIPDRRIKTLHGLVNLTGKSVLEVGCFEGIHTLGLRLYTDNVTAIDIRPVNVIKTLARLSMHGSYAKVFVADVERLSAHFGEFDVIFHCGVLYHLMSPVEHLFSLAGMCQCLFLDTHVASEGRVEKTYRNFDYQGAYHEEAGWHDPFSGRGLQSLWLTEESLLAGLREAGFSSMKFIERRDERNGPRVTILATR